MLGATTGSEKRMAASEKRPSALLLPAERCK